MRMPFEHLMEYVQSLSEDDKLKTMGELARVVGEDASRLSDAVTAVRVLNGERTYIQMLH